MNELEKRFLQLLQTAVEGRASDIHLATNQPPAIRGHQGLLPVSLPPFTAEELEKLGLFMVSNPKLKAQFAELQDIDGSFDVNGLGRFRFNIYRTVGGLSAVLRVISSKVPTIEELGLPEVLFKIADASRGLILVTGATGSGKSSTLAAMINFLNTNQKLHILTVEDPVEFVHPPKMSRMSQREIGKNTESFAVALKSALRQDPDVILVGEMRDIETLDIALKAAETGHVVFSTVHTSDAMKTIGRLISLYPAEQQPSVRLRLAENLHAVISQRLVPGLKGGKVVAQEIMINNLAIQECIINEKKTSEIPDFIEKGREVSGMQTFDQHLTQLVQREVISMETGIAYASNPSDFARDFAFSSSGSGANTGSLAVHTKQTDGSAGLMLDEDGNLNLEAPAAPAQAAQPAPASPHPATKLTPLPKPVAKPAPAAPAAGTSTKLTTPPAPPAPPAAPTKTNIKLPKLPGAA